MIHLPCLSKIVMLVDIFSPLALKLTLLISGSHIIVNISSTYMTPFWSLETKAGHTSKSLNGSMIITFLPQEERSSYHPACSVLLRKRRLVTRDSTKIFQPKSIDALKEEILNSIPKRIKPKRVKKYQTHNNLDYDINFNIFFKLIHI